MIHTRNFGGSPAGFLWIQTKIQNGLSSVSLFSSKLTNWDRNDALRKQGILPPKPPDPNDEFEEALQLAVESAEANRLENLNLDELAELEDDEDDEFLESYRFG